MKEKIPLQLSKQSLKNAQAVIKLMFLIKMLTYFSTTEHYCLNISPKESQNRYEEILALKNDLSAVEKHSQILKIHKQFGHATITNMKKLLKNATYCQMKFARL